MAFRAPIGTRDVLPPESTRARRLVTTFADIAERAGYGQVSVPIFEDLGVFLRIGEATEVVTKEMYDFEDKGGRRIALRPELTASIVRAFIEHHPATPWKVWATGPNFRYERPQKGRWRQFDQVDVEVLGADDPGVDVEVIALAWRFFEALGLHQLTLKLNSLGDAGDRAGYVEALRAFFTTNSARLTEDARATLDRNPLRVLDSKREGDAAVIAEAPEISDHLSPEAAEHFAAVQAGLDALRIPYEVTPRLVRGLDYYVRTTFEIASGALDGAQDAVGGGGRYDGLAEDLGGPATPGMGMALGVDRILLACDGEGVFAAPSTAVDAFVVDVTGGSEAIVLTDELRAAGLGADRAFESRSMKSQMKAADRSGAAVALIVGEQELTDGTVVARDMRTSEQETVARNDVVEHVRKLVAP